MAANKLLDLLILNMSRSPWCQEQSLEVWLKEIQGEAKEASEARSPQDTAEELGDVLSDTLMSMMALAKLNPEITLVSILEKIQTKLIRRKPWLLEGEVPSPEEEWRIWKEVKAQEKAEKQNGPRDDR